MSPQPRRRGSGGRLVSGEESEAAFQSAVEGLLPFYGWRHFHAPDNRPTQAGGGRAGKQRIAAGFPDLIAIRDDPDYAIELVVAELKAERGRVRPEQEAWLEAFRALGGSVARAWELVVDESLEPTRGPEPVVDVYVWRPSDWPAIEQRLARGRVLQPSIHR